MFKRITIFLFIICSLSFSTNNTVLKQRKEVVFCLDLSGSTNGLIVDIRDNLWRFINYSLITNPGTDLRIGIVVYGRPSFGADNDYVKILSDLTDNYDYLSQELIKLKPNIETGTQRLPSAIYAACKNISWSTGSNSKKLIFIFGNGIVPVTNNNFLKACKIAEENNIVIYPVYCVQKNIIVREIHGYKTLADRTGGKFTTFPISHRSPATGMSANASTLRKLNTNLNNTYVYYSKDGVERFNMMVNADENPDQLNELFLYSRFKYKLSEQYQRKCASWDIISLMKLNMPDFMTINPAYLPKDCKQLTPQELYEKMMRTRQIRYRIESEIQTIHSKLNINDTLSINPIDTIIFTQLR
ncbi:MAG TPA: vWA domain-containing protein [Bacteroidia bacterium]|nr:vWA domain-containing protein [Bacteroidia bacterium]